MGSGRAAHAAVLLSGTALRLVFAASVLAGGYGVYLAWFASLGQRAPGHDRSAGTQWMGIALAVSLLASGLLLAVPPLARTAQPARYRALYSVFATVFLTIVLPLSGALRTIDTWERSNTPVMASASGCYDTDDDDGGTTSHCDLTWSVHGHTYEQVRLTHASYPDGTAVALWVDPVTGGADDHDWVVVASCFAGVFSGLWFSGAVLTLSAGSIARSAPTVRRRRTTHEAAAGQAPESGSGDTPVEDARPDR